MTDLVWLAIALPLLGFLFNVLDGWRLPRRFAGYVGCAAVGLAFLVAVIALVGLLGRPAEARFVDLPLWTWIAAGDLSVRFGLLLDPLSALMLLVVTGVGFLIHVYATGYMEGDPGYARFFAYMNLFAAAMLTLVLADNFLMLLVGWGGVGLCSYLLIAFWFDRPGAARAAVKAFVVNSLGDVGLLLAIFLIFGSFGTLDYDTVFRDAPRVLGPESGTVTAIALLLLVGAVAKSAQLPLYVWLPDAMAGPTPVSALIHAATMVTAGVYLIARAHPLYELSSVAMEVVAGIGAATALFAASAALVKTNIKRVLAYSTVSQVGYMFLGVGVGGFTAGVFHLTTHAFFKALLFLAAGGVIHALGGEEDLRKMGGLWRRLPTVYWSFLIGALALAGFPLLSGFFSKDEVIYAAFVSPRGGFVWGLAALAAAGLTAIYIFRALFLAFHGGPYPTNGSNGNGHLHTVGRAMTAPLVALVGLAALAGYLQFPGAAFEGFLRPVFERYGAPEIVRPALDGAYWTVSGLAVVATLAGIGLAYVMYSVESPLPPRLSFLFSGVYQLLNNDFYVEAGYRLAFVRPLTWLASALSDAGERAIDGAVIGGAAAVRRLSAGFGRLETGYVRTYALAVLAGVVAVLAYLVGTGG